MGIYGIALCVFGIGKPAIALAFDVIEVQVTIQWTAVALSMSISVAAEYDLAVVCRKASPIVRYFAQKLRAFSIDGQFELPCSKP